MMKPNRTSSALCGLAVFALVSVPAGGQERMDGTALDANLNPLSGRVNPAGPRVDFRARNALITQNVVGGRGFRGSVGYLAEYDFRGNTGSDDLYRFRADAAWSDVNFINLGESYQRLRFGQEIGLVEYRRASEAAALPSLAHRQAQPRQIRSSQIMIDRLAFASSITASSEAAAEPADIGFIQDEEGTPFVISASALQGLSQTDLRKEPHLMGLSSLDIARVLDDAAAGREMHGLGRPYQTSYTDLLAPETRVEANAGATGDDPNAPLVEPDMVQSRLDMSIESDFQQIQDRVAALYADLEAEETPESRTDEEMAAELEEDLQRLRDHLRADPPEPDESEPEPGDFQPSETGEEMPGDEEDMDSYQPTEPVDLTADIEKLAAALRHGQRIESLSVGDETRLNELIAQGEQSLRAGEYFYAEKRFQRALRFMPGHPLATVGLAHAQLGAGLYVPAALTLRSLYSYQPEMIDAQYESGLVPGRPRLLRAVDTLEKRLDQTRDRANSAFLLAYAGRLLGDRAIMERGLGVLAATEPDEPLVKLLQSIWLAEEKPQPEPRK